MITNGIHLLIADDNELNRVVAKGLLERAGFSVTLASDGKEALDQMEMQFFDAVLMDMQMPVMDGLEATRIIRKQEKFKKIPIIALTAGVTEEERQKCIEAGMNDFIGKPINMEKFIASLFQWFRHMENEGK